MSTSTIGLFAGLLLGIAAFVGGFPAFIIALFLGFVGFVVGGAVSGEIDLSALTRGRGRG